MGAILSRIVWFIIVASILAYATYLVAGTIVRAQASGENEPVVVRDELGAGVHHLSGMVMVPTPCYQLSVRTQEVSDARFALVFRTWHEPSVECDAEPTPRHFRAVLFAPSTGISFSATLDGVSLPVVVLPALHGQPLFQEY